MPASVRTTFFAERVQRVATAQIPAFLTTVGSEYSNEVKRMMRDSPATGREYRSSVSKRTHRASAPGEPPAPDSGDLLKSVTFRLVETSLGWTVQVGSRLKKALYLEFGAAKGVRGKSGRIEAVQWILFPRPVWGPALAKIRRRMPEIIAKFASRRRRR